MEKFYFTSESVTEGHPDKICDQISDAVLDEVLKDDKDAHVACEVCAAADMITVMGEISTKTKFKKPLDVVNIAKSVLKDIGYTTSESGIDSENCTVVTAITEQSADIAMGVNHSKEYKESCETKAAEMDLIGAGDQGMVFGYACNETPELMPLPISLAHKMAKRLTELRKQGILPYLLPDGKTQVTVEYEGNTPIRVDTVVVSTQHKDVVSQERIWTDIYSLVIKEIVPPELLKDTKCYINPTGRFVIGGPQGDSGLTGRKIIVDTYGGYARHGGGAFSGKDPTKVDRSAAYAARYVAKNIVAAGLADKCEIQIAYAIGVANPVSIMVNTFGTGAAYSDRVLERMVQVIFDLRPSAIIKNLNLKNTKYRKLAAYGHFGENAKGCKWEDTDKVPEILRYFNKS